MVKPLILVKVKVAQLCLTLCDPMDYRVHGILQARVPEWVAVPFSGRSSQPRDWTQVSDIAPVFFTVWASREAMNTGVGSLSLLQGIFPTQELNRGLLHWRLILCQTSYQENTFECVDHNNWKILKEIGIPGHLTCLLRNLYAGQEQKLESNMEQQTGSKLAKECIKVVYCHPVYLM